MQLDGKVAIITGGSRGIGKAIAKAFVREGATAVICGRKAEGVEAAARDIGERAIPVACHVGKPEDLERLVTSVTGKYGHIDILVNNTHTNVAQGPALTIDDNQFDKTIEVNLKTDFQRVHLVGPGMC